MTDEERQIELVGHTCVHLLQEGSALRAVIIVCDDAQLVVVPLRLTMEQARMMISVAYAGLTEHAPEDKGEIH